tara:strand:- start:239 stop:451 length:213 start_codon:yes stop_codon:yes gene_type:complete
LKLDKLTQQVKKKDMKIKLKKNWRYAGQVHKAGASLNIKNKDIIAYLKDNDYLKEKKDKKSKEKPTQENN